MDGIEFQDAIAESRSEREVGRVRLKTLIRIRWVALTGQTAAILFVRYGLGYDMPVLLSLAAVAASALVNVILSIQHPASTRLSDGEAVLYLAFDTLQLAVLLFLTGGIQNPFSILLLVPVTISSTILSLRSTVRLGAITLASLTLVAIYHLPLPWQEGGLQLPSIYVFGIWTSLTLGLAFITIYTFRIAEEKRRMSDALAETKMALAREQRMSALGGLAASTAHELGTPLGTITLVAKELRREAPARTFARALKSRSRSPRKTILPPPARPANRWYAAISKLSTASATSSRMPLILPRTR